MILDIYTHILPDRFFREMSRVSPRLENIGARLRGVKKLFDLDAALRRDGRDRRLRAGHLAAQPAAGRDRAGRDRGAARARRQRRDGGIVRDSIRQRFPAFVAAVSLDDVDAALKEAERAITTLGARGIQIFTNIAGHPLDEARFTPVFAALAAHDLPIWLHPARTAAMPDYAAERKVALRDVVVLRLAVRDQRRDGAAGVFRRVRPPSRPEDRHASSRRRHDPVLRRAHRRRHGGARLAHLGRGLLEGAVRR